MEDSWTWSSYNKSSYNRKSVYDTAGMSGNQHAPNEAALWSIFNIQLAICDLHLWVPKSADRGHTDKKYYFSKIGELPRFAEKHEINIKIYRGV